MLLAGCGDIGLHLGRMLVGKGWAVTGLKRSTKDDAGFVIFQGDLLDPDSLQGLAPQYDFIVYTATPGSRTPEGYEDAYITGLKNLMKATAQPSERFFLVSSSGVYQQSSGEWVDEDSPTLPESFSGKILLRSEQLAQASWDNTSVVRFAGIYGPGRLRLVRKVQQGCSVVADPIKYTNRIHRDDCVRLLAFLMEKQLAGVSLAPLYLGCDDTPVGEAEVLEYLADLLNVPPPLRETKQPPVNQNKRCSNQRITELGFHFQYPGYREGYLQILRQDGLLL